MSKQRLQISAALFAALSLAHATSHADENKAVERTNYSLGLVASDSDTKDSTSNGTFGLGGIVTMPIGDLFGASLSGAYSRSTARTSKVLADTVSNTSSRPSCRFNNTDGELTVFARRPTLGRISASYGKGNVKSDCGDDAVFVSTGDETLGLDNYSLAVEAYLGDFTFGVARISTELEDGPKLESDTLTAMWYPIEDVRISLYGGDLYDQDTYGIEIEHQPEFMGDSLSVTLGYSVVDRDQQIGTINFGVIYHFGTKVELKRRDREFR